MLKCCLSPVCPWGLVFVDSLLAPPLSHDWGHQPVEIVFRLPVSESEECVTNYREIRLERVSLQFV